MSKHLGVDLGYGFTKSTDGESLNIIPSVVGVGQNLKFTLSLGIEKRPLDNIAISMEGNKYFVGDMAIRHSEIASRSLGENRVDDFDAKVLLRSCLGLYSKWENDSFSVVTGLPSDYFSTYYEKWEQELRGTHTFSFCQGGKEIGKIVDIKEVKIIPQPFGTLFCQVLGSNGDIVEEELVNSKIGIIDIGYKTTDYAVADKLEYIDRLSHSTKSGMSTAYGLLAEQIRETYGLSIEDYKLDGVITEQQLKIGGKNYDVREMVEQSYRRLADKIVTEINSYWDPRELDIIWLTGGGGKALAPYILKRFNNISLVNNPQTANVDGYYKLCKHLF